MWWPSPSDYQDTVQNPRVAFSDAELRQGTLVTDALGLPKPISGSFATIYQVNYQGRRHAVRCFLRHVPDIAQRYAAISTYLEQHPLPNMVEFRFLAQGIRVRGQWFPILKMEWLEGEQLDVYVARHLRDSQALLDLTRQFLHLALALRQANIAHGDLQHGNLLVVNNQLRLLDYDGMYVPVLAGRPSNELGQPNYQHPIRSERDFGPHLDNFSVWVITLSLMGLALDPALRATYASGGESLLLDREDFANPYSSKTLSVLQQTSNPTLRFLTGTFLPYLFARDLHAIPPLDPQALANLQVAPTAAVPYPDWLRDQLPETPAPAAQPAAMPAPPTGPEWLLDHVPPTPAPQLNGSFRFEKSVLTIIFLMILLSIGIALAGVPVPQQILFGLFALLPVGAALALRLGYSWRFNSPDRRDAERAVNEFEAARVRLGERIQQLAFAQTHVERDQREEMSKLVKLQADNAAREKMGLEALDQSLANELTRLSERRKKLSEQEASVIETALKKLQAERQEKMLDQHRVADAMLPGIVSRELKQRLAANGFVTAADITNFTVNPLRGGKSFGLVNRHGAAVYVEGVNPKQGVALILWRRAMEAQVKKKLPTALPADVAAKVQKRFKDEIVSLQLAELKKKQEAQTTKARLTDSARKEQEKLTRAMQDLPDNFRRKRSQLEQDLIKARKDLAEKEWGLVLARRRLQTFAHVSFFKYLRSILGL